MKKWHAGRKVEKEKAIEIEKTIGQRIASISSTRDVTRYQFTNLVPSSISGVLQSVTGGFLNTWSDFCDYMLEVDPGLKGLIELRVNEITKSKLIIQPSDESEEAKQVADFIRKSFDNIPEFDKRLRQLNFARFNGCSVQEIIYDFNEESEVYEVKEIIPVSLKKIKIRLNPITSTGETVETNITTGYGKFIYSYWNYGDTQYGEGIDMHGVFPGKFIIHSPGDEIMPHYRGLMRSLAWPWFFKRIAEGFYMVGCEGYAFPFIYAKVPSQTPLETRQQLSLGVGNARNDTTMVLDENVEIETINPGATGGTNAWQQNIDHWVSEMTKLVLGGNLNVESGGANGSYALGKVHQQTLLSLLEADASSLAETLKFQLIKPMLEFNKHLFGNKVPKLPHVQFDIDTPVEIPQMAIDAGIVTNNELRKSLGLPLWTKEQGGDNIAKISLEAIDPIASMAMAIPNSNVFNDASTAYNNKEKDIAMTIEQEGSDWIVKSKSGKELGRYKTKEEAIKRLREVEYYK